MKIIIIALLCISQLSFAQSMQRILENHYDRLDAIQVQRLNFYETVIATALKKFGGQRLNDRTINYLAVNEQFIIKFKKAATRANKISEEVCGDRSTHFNDEGDAFRHLVWSGLLSLYLGEDIAFNLTSLHEDKPDNDTKSMKMDLWNNNRGITIVEKSRAVLEKLPTQKREELITKAMKKVLEFGGAKVLKNGTSRCVNKLFYPNL